MKTWLLALLLLSVLVSVAISEEQQAQEPESHHNSFADAEELDAEEEVQQPEGEYAEEEIDIAQKEEELDGLRNPCIDKKCRRGETCSVEKSRRGKCVCIPQCDTHGEEDHRFQVCSKKNVTYESECELDRDHCLCRRRLEGCSQEGVGNVQLDYFGPCQELTPCPEREFKEFPGRMREWLYIVMKQMAQKAEIPDYLDLLEKARDETNHTHAVLWKFCDLDVSPQDRFVTRQELLYTIQSLKALEHCLIPFLDHCDTDPDGQITLVEWGHCLGLDDGAIHDECKNIRRAGGREKK